MWLFIGMQMHAQFFQNHALYLSAGMTISDSDYSGLNSSYRYVFKERVSLNYGSLQFTRQSRDIPNDYQGGFLAKKRKPLDSKLIKYVSAGYILNLTQSHVVRLNLCAGIARINESCKSNWKKNDGGRFGPNYYGITTETEALGIFLNPRFEISPKRWFGIELSPYAVIACDKTTMGGSFSLMFGLIRGKH